MTKDPERLIRDYEAGVEHPDVSGMEHLNLLLVRSSLAQLEAELTDTQRDRLGKADQKLFVQAGRFLHAIQQIADLESWRAQEKATPEQWWWYLDVISHLPVAIGRPEKQVVAA